MHLSRLFSAMLVVATTVGATIVACGGSSNPKTPDAKVFKDSKTFLDGSGGSAGLTGLGQKCGSGLPTCPTNAPECIGAQGTTQFCSPICDMNATGTTGSGGTFPASGTGAITPAPSNTTCTAAYMGTVGTAACDAIVASTPAYTGQATTSFTGIKMDCLVVCGTGNTCPPSMTCNTTLGACLPN